MTSRSFQARIHIHGCSLHRSIQALAAAALGAAALSACSVADLRPPGTSSSADTPAVAVASPTVSGEFSFPQTTCGDQASSPSETWYPVYIDNGDIAAIRSKYCKDAVSVVRDKTGVPSIQVASFTSADKAQRFATAVSGEVEPVGVSRASLDAQTGSSASPNSAASATSATNTSSKTATLSSSEPQAPINVRDRASTSAPIAHVGYGGDRIQITETTQGDDGYTWYSIRLDSGEKGWVRGDFVSQSSASQSSASQSMSPSGSSSASDSADRAPTASASPSSSTGSSTDSSTASGRSSGAVRSATLTASDSSASINVRSSASTTSNVQSTAYAGDRIQVVDRIKGDDGYTWYSIQLESGEQGWVRSDFVSGQ